MPPIKGHVAMLGANVIWGLMSPLTKLVLLGGLVTPLVITNLRVSGAMVLFWIVSFFQKPERVEPKDYLKLLGASFLAVMFNQGSFVFGVGLTSPGDASIITTSMPLWAMLLAAFFLKEPITLQKVGGILAGALGAILLIMGGQETTGVSKDTYIWGDLLILGAQVCYASYIVLFKDFVMKYSLVTIMKWMFTFGFLAITPISLSSLMSTQWASLSLKEIGSILFIVVLGTFVSYILILIGQRVLRPTVAAMYNYFQPIIACLVAITLGLDVFNLYKGVAVILIFSGVYLVTKSRAKETGKEVT